ncbi:MAG: DUF2281 domain-containing protein [Methylococcaceae bacterium]
MPTVDLSTLPANAQQELLDFYEFLQEKYARRKANPVALTQQQAAQTDFKNFIMNIPKVEGGIEFERQHDYPSNN